MTSSASVLRKFISRPSRHVSTTSSGRTSTSPQRRRPASAPKMVYEPRPFEEIPGPLALPMLRHSAHVLPRIGNFHHAVGLGLLEGMQRRYGDLVRLAKGSRTRPVLYVFDPEVMREVYESSATEPPRWLGSPLSDQRKRSGCPMNGDDSKAIWAALRALLQDGGLLKNYDQILDDIADDFTKRLGELSRAENALNEELETEVYRWAVEALGSVVLGTRLGCLDGDTHVPNDNNRTPQKTSIDDEIPDTCSLTKRDLTQLTEAEQLVRSCREIADGHYLTRSEETLKTDSKGFEHALKAFDKHLSLIEHFLVKSLSDLKAGHQAPETSLLERLRPLNSRLLPVAADMMLAGVEPLAQSALGMFYELSLHAASQQRAHDEIIWAKASVDAGAGQPDMPYIAAAVRESLRLRPATGGVVRRSKKEFVVDGYAVPSGVDIVLAHGISSKCDKQWTRRKAFIPERWYNEGWRPLRASQAHPNSSFPFGESCPAEGIVGKMLGCLATRVLDKYRLEWHGPAPGLVTTSVNKLQTPFYFVLQKAA